MDNNAHILIVEDDVKIAALLADYFVAAGLRVTRVADGLAAVEAVRAHAPDLMVLDLMLPSLDGIGVCRAVRAFSALPIIMLTARVDEIDRLLGLESGADDYVCKPFSPREVVARVRAHLRRAAGMAQLAAGAPAAATAAAAAQAPQFQVERERMCITYGGVALALTPVEFRLLAELMANPGRVYSRQQLLDCAHEDQRDNNDRTVDSHIKNIRRKLAARVPESECLQSVYGVGYRFELPPP
ncbi:response regulator [Duganella sp. LX20W]|uniref:Response regulator n=1 Tax=Rugamonas brunnea TaxID=2758569 RepID=A0A7W2ET04_9BURK|nr:response regulator [Rugamonas brunnea]MBA5638072.1 response regulator [Rugamonas brunnea]